MTHYRCATTPALVAVLLATTACDLLGPPDDPRGVYNLVQVGDLESFPIYLGRRPLSDPVNTGFIETWLVGGVLQINNSEYAFQPLIRTR